MRLLCINNKEIAGAANGLDMLSMIREGQEYEGDIRWCKLFNGSIGVAWCIPSISTTRGYDLKRFIQLPDTSADDMAEVEKEAIVNLEPAR